MSLLSHLLLQITVWLPYCWAIFFLQHCSNVTRLITIQEPIPVASEHTQNFADVSLNDLSAVNIHLNYARNHFIPLRSCRHSLHASRLVRRLIQYQTE
jgi:hypothetical protein